MEMSWFLELELKDKENEFGMRFFVN